MAVTWLVFAVTSYLLIGLLAIGWERLSASRLRTGITGAPAKPPPLLCTS